VAIGQASAPTGRGLGMSNRVCRARVLAVVVLAVISMVAQSDEPSVPLSTDPARGEFPGGTGTQPDMGNPGLATSLHDP